MHQLQNYPFEIEKLFTNYFNKLGTVLTSGSLRKQELSINSNFFTDNRFT